MTIEMPGLTTIKNAPLGVRNELRETLQGLLRISKETGLNKLSLKNA
jgi:hypothetical protein